MNKKSLSLYNIKLVVSDIDGTLIQGKEKFPTRISQTAKILRRKGILFTFASGRLPYKIDPYLTLIDSNVPVVACNGALVYCGKKILKQECMPVKPLRKLVRHADKLNMTVLYAMNGIEYCLRETPYVEKKKKQRGNYHLLRPLSIQDWESLQVNKMNIMDDSGLNRICNLEADLNLVAHSFSVTHYENSGLEIVCGTADKFNGIMEICNRINLSAAQVMAIGDGENDCRMLQNSGIGVAVANADDNTKSCADYVCNNAGAAGVYEAIKKFCFFGE